VALDSVKTPLQEHHDLLGGSASYASVAASFFGPVKMVGIVGTDFPEKHLALYRKHGIDLDGLQIADGKTFRWSGEYEWDLNQRRTLSVELNVFETFQPNLPESYKRTPYVFLANISPQLQMHVLAQVAAPKFTVADTMDLWLNIALADLLKLLKRLDAFVLNDSEAHQLTTEDNVFSALKKIHKLGPKYVIIKKGSHGSILSGPRGFFICPAYPLHKVVDPTGAGDSFVGGFMGYLATARGGVEENIRRAMIYGSVVASFCCEGFGLKRTTRVTRAHIDKRVRELEQLTRF